jgi:hypothetical protein
MKLADCTLTIDSETSEDMAMRSSRTEILLANIQSLGFFITSGGTLCGILLYFKVPALKRFTLNKTYRMQLPIWSQFEFFDMLDRSGCNLEAFELFTELVIVTDMSFSSRLPSIVELITSEVHHLPRDFFETLIRGEILQNLKRLKCFIRSPLPVLQLLEYYSEDITANDDQELSWADISFRGAAGSSEVSQRIERLSRKMKILGKDITLKGVRLSWLCRRYTFC